MTRLQSLLLEALIITVILSTFPGYIGRAQDPESQDTSTNNSSNETEYDEYEEAVKLNDDVRQASQIARHAHPGDKCDNSMYKEYMAPFNEAIANGMPMMARDTLDNISAIVENKTEVERSEFVMNICYGAALMCSEKTGLCECLNITMPNGLRYKFIAEKDHHGYHKQMICRGDVDTSCESNGFPCRKDHICLDNVCTLAESRGSLPVLSPIALSVIFYERFLWLTQSQTITA